MNYGRNYVLKYLFFYFSKKHYNLSFKKAIKIGKNMIVVGLEAKV